LGCSCVWSSVFLAAIPAGLVEASSNGNFGNNDFSQGGCTACHAPGSSYQPQASLTGPGEFTTNAWIAFTLTIEESGAPFPIFGGFQLSTSNGSVRPASIHSKIVGATVAHAAPRSFAGNDTSRSASWPIEISSETTGNITVYWCAVAANGDILGSGDQTVCGSRALTVCEDLNDNQVCDADELIFLDSFE
jgi:hypothetical protein